MVSQLFTIILLLLYFLAGCLSLIVVFAICYVIYFKTNTTVAGLAEFPGPSWWTLMNILFREHAYSDFRGLFCTFIRQYGSRFKTIASVECPYLVLTTSEDLQFLLTHPELLDKGQVLAFYEPWFGQGLINAHMLTTGITEESIVLDFIRGATKFNKSVAKRFGRPWYYYEFLWKLSRASKDLMDAAQILDNTFKKAISKAREAGGMRFKENLLEGSHVGVKHERKTFLQVMETANAGNYSEYSEEEILRGVMNVAAAASGTTGVTLSWIFYLLGTMPTEQKLLQEEVDLIFESIESNDPRSGYELMHEMKKVDSFIYETLRTFPAVDVIERRAAQNVKFPDGTTIPAGTLVVGFLGMPSRNPEIFPDPDSFDMTRFVSKKTEKNAKRHSTYDFLPFSAGPRNCIGSQVAMIVIKSVMIEVLSRFNVTTHSTLEEIGCKYYLGMHPVNPIKISLEHRKK